MTITLWVHRARASGILVDFHDNQEREAYLLATKILEANGEHSISNMYGDGPIEFDEGGSFDIGCTPFLQLSLHYTPYGFHPKYFSGFGQAWDQIATVWSRDGYALVSPEEAIALGPFGEPDGFVPGESEIWIKN